MSHSDTTGARKSRAAGKRSAGFSAEERAAMQERANELRAEARANTSRAAGARDLLAKIAALPEPDRTMAERIHAMVTASAPELAPRTWYGMPAYANGDGKVVCSFTPASKFNALRDRRLQRRGEPGRWHHGADVVRAHGGDRGRRGADRRAGEASGAVTTMSWRRLESADPALAAFGAARLRRTQEHRGRVAVG
jgi:uncharacterized protein YdhG (YjbR/CyaY superfamily)